MRGGCDIIILLWQSYHPLEKRVIGNMGFVIRSLQETLPADWYHYEMKRIKCKSANAQIIHWLTENLDNFLPFFPLSPF